MNDYEQSFPPGSNRQPADYESAALPVAPEKHNRSFSSLEGTAGVEPATIRLTAGRSTN